MVKSFEEIRNKIDTEYSLLFKLYNATYKISHIENNYYIEQIGINSKKKYNSLEEMFNNYYLYGDTLMELINNIYFF